MKNKYQELWDSMVINKNKESEIKLVVDKILKNKERYLEIEKRTSCKWYIVAIIHYMECSLDFSKHLFNGDSLKDYTKRYPSGYPKNCGKPPFKWEDSATESIRKQGLHSVPVWNIPICLAKLEAYNGMGYANKGLNTPYLWSYTNHYTKGKYKEVKQPNGKYKSIYDPELVSKQLGCAALLKYLID